MRCVRRGGFVGALPGDGTVSCPPAAVLDDTSEPRCRRESSVDLIGFSAGASWQDGLSVSTGHAARRIVTLGSPPPRHEHRSLAGVGREVCPAACREMVPQSPCSVAGRALPPPRAGGMWTTKETWSCPRIGRLEGSVALGSGVCPRSGSGTGHFPGSGRDQVRPLRAGSNRGLAQPELC